MDTILSIIFAVFFLIFLTIFMTYFRNSGQREVDKWAKKKGYEIISSEFRWVKKGPYFISSNTQRVFYLTLKDKNGIIKNAWVKVGGVFFGLLSDIIDITWDKKGRL